MSLNDSENSIKQGFTNASPMDFTLNNPVGGPWQDHPNDTIFIVDVMGKTKIEQTLVIKNRSQYAVSLNMLADDETYHFRLAFRNGSFQVPFPLEFDVKSGWTITAPKNHEDGSWSVDFICQYSQTLDPNDEIAFPFSYRTADPTLGKRGTRMKLYSQGLYFDKHADSFKATTEKQIDVLNLSSNNAYISEIATQITQYDSKTDDIEAALLSSLYATKDDNEGNLEYANDLTKDIADTAEQADSSADSESHGELSGQLNTSDTDTKTAAANAVIADTSRKDKLLRNKLDQTDEYGERKFARMKQLITLLVQHGIELDNEVDLKSLAYNVKFETLEALYPFALSCETPTGLVMNQTSSLSVFLYNRSDQSLSFHKTGSIKLLLPFGNDITDISDKHANTGQPVHTVNTYGTLEKQNNSSDKSVFIWQPASRLVIEKGDYLELKINSLTPSENLGRCFIDARISGLIGQQDNQFSLPLTKVSPDLAQLSGNQNVGVGTGIKKPEEALDVQGNIISSGNISSLKSISASKNISASGIVNATGYINTSNKIKEKGYDLIPKGFIAMFYNSSIPGGWALCDGSNGTPDLRNRFVVAAGGKYGSGNKGGLDEVELSLDEMPEHKHSVKMDYDGEHTHSVKIPYQDDNDDNSGFEWWGGRDGYKKYTTSNDGSHKHDINEKDIGSSQPHENRPPYYALCYIMKL